VVLTSGFLCKLYKSRLKQEEIQKTDFSMFQWKNIKLSPEKTQITRGEHSYTRSYPQYPQKSTTSVVHENSCQVRKFVLEFVIKSQKKVEKEEVRRNTTFLDKRIHCK